MTAMFFLCADVLMSFASKVEDQCWIGSVQGAVATWSKPWKSKTVKKYYTLITDQVATAPCTDRIQDRRPTLITDQVATAPCTDCIQDRRPMLITDQVATAPCTDRIQDRRPTLTRSPERS